VFYFYGYDVIVWVMRGFWSCWHIVPTVAQNGDLGLAFLDGYVGSDLGFMVGH
jgi:hypothetical protein